MDRLRISFDTIGIDALVATHLPNIRYLCGFCGSAGVLLIDDNGATLFTDSRYTLQARQETSGVRVEIAKGGLLRAAGSVLKVRRGIRRVGYAPASVTVAQKDALEKSAGRHIGWIEDGGIVEKLRAVKDRDEVTRMRGAAKLISGVFEGLLGNIRVGMTELELAAEIEYAIKQHGGSGTSFETIVASGERSAWPHARPTEKMLGKGELVVLDQGAILSGYCSDMTRTVFLGRASAKVRRLYQAVLEAQEAGKRSVRPGVKAEDVDKAARAVLQRRGLDRYFTHSTGHGLGLEVHEMPRLGQGEKTILQEGMVLTVEPGVYVEGIGGIRIEDDVVVTARGAQELTTAPREFLEL
jgi:Xaa-Pro aminopeptidase